ncbi:MAG: hypothetical protein E6G68_10760 [Actinobacteria bacterium]|nr:MAG: hypothetical protein E6G68_10760 [Actinomycetota bacterium]
MRYRKADTGASDVRCVTASPGAMPASAEGGCPFGRIGLTWSITGGFRCVAGGTACATAPDSAQAASATRQIGRIGLGLPSGLTDGNGAAGHLVCRRTSPLPIWPGWAKRVAVHT